jgi:hypothetical protein
MLGLYDKVSVPEGVFKLYAWGPNGTLVDYVEGHNIVVNGGRNALSRLIGGDTSLGALADWTVDTIKFGDGGHNPSDPTEMIAVDVTDSDLYGSIIISKSVTTIFPATRQVQFSATVETSEGNGSGTQEYSEAGLYYDSGTTMFAHKSFGYVVKNSTIRLTATWLFTF